MSSFARNATLPGMAECRHLFRHSGVSALHSCCCVDPLRRIRYGRYSATRSPTRACSEPAAVISRDSPRVHAADIAAASKKIALRRRLGAETITVVAREISCAQAVIEATAF